MKAHSKNPATVYAALVAAQQAAPAALGKLDRNDFANFDYVAADRMIIAAREALLTAGLALVPWALHLGQPGVESLAGKHMHAATLQCVYRLVHSSGEWIEVAYDVPVITKAGTPLDKATFGAMTEGLGYAYRGLLSIGRLSASEVPADVSSRDDTDYEPQPPAVAVQGAAAVATAAQQQASPPQQSAAQQQPAAQADTGAGQLAGEYIAQVKALEAAAAVDGANLAGLLEQLEQIPAAAAQGNLGNALQMVAAAYNPVVTALRERLGGEA